MKLLVKILFFCLLLFIVNSFLFKHGYWFAQDTSYWPKNNYEALTIFIQQLHVFTNFGYYIGFDQGLFNFTRIIPVGFTLLLFHIFGYNGSQLAYAIFGFLLTYIAVYLFSGVIFEERDTRYLISLVYTFNPFSYTLQGAVFYMAAIPLFLYAYYMYFYSVSKVRFIYILIALFACYIWISYIRFFESNFFVVIPYLLYFFFKNGRRISLKKIVVFLICLILLFSPIIYSVLMQLIEKSQTAFFYGAVLGHFVGKGNMVNAFNVFQSIGVHLYQGTFWIFVGLVFFIILLISIIAFPKRKSSTLLVMNLLLVMFAIGLYGLANIVGDTSYIFLLKIFPFIINGPYFGLFILDLPLAVIFGILASDKKAVTYFLASFFMLFSLLPFLNFQDRQFSKFDISKIPSDYEQYFIAPYTDIPESTYYFSGPCWPAKYMMDYKIPVPICLNFGYHFSPTSLADPRLVAGMKYIFSQNMENKLSINNMRVTHNLKDIIVPLDATNADTRTNAAKAIQIFDHNPLLVKTVRPNFIHYFFKNKDQYDFFIYSPNTIVYKQSNDALFDNNLRLVDRPTVLTGARIASNTFAQNIGVSYKISPINPTKYYLHFSNLLANNPFFIQFNQDYGDEWRLKLVDQQYFDRRSCVTQWEHFSITETSRCQYEADLLDLQDLHLLWHKDLPSIHVESNFISNGWMINPKNILGFNTNRNLYIVLISMKQIFYTFFILLACISVAFLILFAIIQESLRLRWFKR